MVSYTHTCVPIYSSSITTQQIHSTLKVTISNQLCKYVSITMPCFVTEYKFFLFSLFKDPNADTQWNDQLRRFNIIGAKDEIKTEDERLEETRGNKINKKIS